jgi:hypothetical protein
VFLHEQKLYPRSELTKHRLEGDPELKLKPHSFCEYCKVWLFSDEELFLHCYQTHETCFICESDGVKYQYFKDYAHLEKHFEEAHFPCKEKSCLQERFVVFRTEFELKAHRVAVHLKGQKLPRRERIVQLSFPTLSFSAQFTYSPLQNHRPLPRNRYAYNIEDDNEDQQQSLLPPSTVNNTNTLTPFRLRIDESNLSSLSSSTQAPLLKRNVHNQPPSSSSSSSTSEHSKSLTKEELAKYISFNRDKNTSLFIVFFHSFHHHHHPHHHHHIISFI